MKTCGLINGVICGIKSDAFCRRAQRRFRNALLFVAVENNREGAARAVRQPRATCSLPVQSTEPGEPLDLDDLALTAGKSRQQRSTTKPAQEVTGLSRKRSRLAELWPADQRHLAA